MHRAGELADAIRRDGYAIAEALISPREVAEIRTSLAPWLHPHSVRPAR